jgi:uncharacterized membrane protein
MSVNPFDPKTVVFAKHAQHVVLIHFPIALFLAGVFLDFLGQWSKKPALSAVAYYNFLLAAISTVPVVATGVAAWQWALEGQKLKGILLMHLVLGVVSGVLLWVVWLIHRAVRIKNGGALPAWRWPIELVTVLVVTITGHLGGFLSGVNGGG